MHSKPSLAPADSTQGWILDAYPSALGEFAVWVVTNNGKRVRLTDKFQPTIFISGKQADLEALAIQLPCNPTVASFGFAYKYAQPTDAEKSRVLEVALQDCRKTAAFAKEVLKLGDYQRYSVYNCDLHGDHAYFFSHNLFPLAYTEIHPDVSGLRFRLWDSVESTSYSVPPLRTLKLSVEIAKKGRIANADDAINKVILTQAEEKLALESGDESAKLLQLVKAVNTFDPDIILTEGGDSFLFAYLIHRASANAMLDEFVLSRDQVPFVPRNLQGRTFFSYGRTFYKAPTTRLFGRIHIDQANTFVLKESGLEGLFEIARTCRMPLHTAARASIGTSMSSLQFYQAIKDEVLIPHNKGLPEAFKSAYELLVGDRGGFVYEPVVGLHEGVGEVDFSSMYPSLMVNNNVSAETVLCRCCPYSELRIPEIDYHICEKRVGIVPKALRLVVDKRFAYKRLKEQAQSTESKDVYEHRQAALKWILVTCFGYLGYRNAKFGTVDGHIGVCALGREAFFKAARIAEAHGFTVIHGIVDSLWLKKPDATLQDYAELCRTISMEVGVTLNFEGRYKWIAFLPSKLHPGIGVLNRYYGAMESGKIKVRGIEVRRRDTPKFVYDTQMQMIQALTPANNITEFYAKIPGVLGVVSVARQRLLDGEVPLWDLMVTKRLSKDPSKYKQQASQVVAAKQAISEGIQVHAGENIHYFYTDVKNKKASRRVKAQQLIEEGSNIDVEKYLLLLYSSAASLLSFAGYTLEFIREATTGQSCKKLTQY